MKGTDFMGAFAWLKKKLMGEDKDEPLEIGEFKDNPVYKDLNWTVNPFFDPTLPMEESESPSPMSPKSDDHDDKIDKDAADDPEKAEKEIQEDPVISGPQGVRAITRYETFYELLNTTGKSRFSSHSANSESFIKLTSSLEAIVDNLHNKLNRSTFADELTNMLPLYTAAIESFDNYISSHKNPRSSSGKARLVLASTMLGYLQKDFLGIKDSASLLPEQGDITWVDILARTREQHIAATRDEIQIKGNGGRERYKVTKDGKTQYFTEKVGYNTVEQTIQQVTPDHDPEYMEIINSVIDKVDGFGKSKDACNFFENFIPNSLLGPDMTTQIIESSKNPEYRKSKVMAVLGLYPTLKDQFAAYKQQHPESKVEFAPDNQDFIDKIYYIGLQLGMVNNKSVAAPSVTRGLLGKNISMRNVAMSRMSDLLGDPTLLARSVNATLTVDGGKQMTGNLMDAAKGIDLTDLKSADKSMVDLSSGQLQKQSIELELLDWVCGQLDRHAGNMLYDFDIDKETGKISRLKGIQGIDNDAAFDQTPLSYFEGPFGFGNTGSMKVSRDKGGKATDFSLPLVPEDMAERILALDKKTISLLLADVIPYEDDINTTWERIQLVQKYLSELKTFKRQDGKSCFVKDGEWDESTADILLHATEDTHKDAKSELGLDPESTRSFRRTYYGRICQKFDKDGSMSSTGSFSEL